ncbi:DUF397 domain-containing protein [Streptomyces termitum]|uniref:Toxin n=1 Tax=Streptomyces termitum TaxID=67368 RepID=A0A918T8K9_9ACTN|nr:DUF397 domain-containing protein [Streptomyces termitum]GHB09728.1 toxin [Streptomyces termitum]
MHTNDLSWFKSSHSTGNGGDCVEVALPWHKSSHSSGGDGDCVEVATCPTTVHVRDSKVPDGPRFTVGPAAWTEFLSRLA